MALQTAGRLVALACAGSLALALYVPADAAAGTFTHISTPSGRTTVLLGRGTPQMTVSGSTSSDVTTVDVVCLRGEFPVDVTTVASSVSVTGGAFTVTAPVPNIGGSGPICRLRALPQGVSPDDPVTMFAGPLLNIDTVKRTTDGTHTLDFRLTAGTGDGQMTAASAGKCGDSSMGAVPPDLAAPVDSEGCVASLGPGAAVGTAGSLRVDGHLALLPYSVLAYTNGTSALHTSFHVAKSGRLTWTESAKLVRCEGTDTYPPPSPGQCGNLLSTGVTFKRKGTFESSGQQVRLRDAFTSNDGRQHRVHAIYGMESTAPDTGALGFAFPGRPGGFHGSSTGQVVTGLPKKAATILVRSDRFAAEGDPQASTRAITWSRTPSRLGFSADDATVFGLRYSLPVHKSGATRLGFTDSHATLTSAATRLGRGAVAAMMPNPSIASPAKKAVLTGKKTVVKGVVRAGVNGLPVSVMVNGHPATITPTSAGRATYKVVFDESLGKHTLTARARDAGGNTRKTSITVRNK
jgi:hypothetical protein